MTSLNLTPFNYETNRKDKNLYKPYEINLIPEKDVDVFVYTTGATDTDKANIQIVKKAFFYAKLDKFNNMTTAQIKAINKNNEDGFVANKTIELHNMYDELAKMFLCNLHRATWNTFDPTKKNMLNQLLFLKKFMKI